MEPVLGAVLVGGASRRMGRDKALLPWDGKPLAVHMLEQLAGVCGRVALVGGSGRGYEQLGWPWWPDPPGLSGAGPMAGLLAALDRAPRVLLVACDLPGLEPWLLRRVLAAGRGRPAAIPEVGGSSSPSARSTAPSSGPISALCSRPAGERCPICSSSAGRSGFRRAPSGPPRRWRPSFVTSIAPVI